MTYIFFVIHSLLALIKTDVEGKVIIDLEEATWHYLLIGMPC